RRDAVDARLSRLTEEEREELKAKISAIRGFNAAYDSARNAAPISSLNHALTGAAIGVPAGMALSALINRKNPSAILRHLGASALIGGGIGFLGGAATGATRKNIYASRNYSTPEHADMGHAARDSYLKRVTLADLEREMHDKADSAYQRAYGVEEAYEETPEAMMFYKKAGVDKVLSEETDIEKVAFIGKMLAALGRKAESGAASAVSREASGAASSATHALSGEDHMKNTLKSLDFSKHHSLPDMDTIKSSLRGAGHNVSQSASRPGDEVLRSLHKTLPKAAPAEKRPGDAILGKLHASMGGGSNF
ncbi:MAG TPA: hypothetical protein VFM18_08245, partial [Methanosarcina sp.]|nr:hypothetical protein [Methanosarcina sp.]